MEACEMCKLVTDFDEEDYLIINFIVSKKGNSSIVKICLDELGEYLTESLSKPDKKVTYDHRTAYKRLLLLSNKYLQYYGNDSAGEEHSRYVTVFAPYSLFKLEYHPNLEGCEHFCTVALSDELCVYITVKGYIEKMLEE